MHLNKFATLIEVSPKHSERITRFFSCRKTWTSYFFFRTGIKRSHSVPSQDYTDFNSFIVQDHNIALNLLTFNNFKSKIRQIVVEIPTKMWKKTIIIRNHNWLRILYIMVRSKPCIEIKFSSKSLVYVWFYLTLLLKSTMDVSF